MMSRKTATMEVEKKDERESESSSEKDDGKIDYDKVIEEFGCHRIEESLIDRVERLTDREPHVFLRRGVFFSHQDFNEILDAYEKGEMFYLYIERRRHSLEDLHLGDLIPLMFTKYLQEAFDVPVVIQLTDDNLSPKEIEKLAKEIEKLADENLKGIIACGFDVNKTFIFDSIGGDFYKNMTKIGECVTINKARGIFDFSDEDPIAKISKYLKSIKD